MTSSVGLLQVYTSSFTETGACEEVALKVIDIPTSIHDPCYQVHACLCNPAPLSYKAQSYEQAIWSLRGNTFLPV